MIEVYKATTAYGSNCHFGVESTARAWAGTNGTVERIELRDPPVLTVVPADDTPRWSKLEALREMARQFVSHPLSRGISDCEEAGELMTEAAAEIERLCRVRNCLAGGAQTRAVQYMQERQAALLALGLLWMTERQSDKVHRAYTILRDALGGKDALRKGIQAAMDAGHEADHPHGADWWAGKKEAAAGVAPSADAQQAEYQRLHSLAHAWAQECYFKGLGRAAGRIDETRAEFQQALRESLASGVPVASAPSFDDYMKQRLQGLGPFEFHTLLEAEPLLREGWEAAMKAHGYGEIGRASCRERVSSPV